MTRREFVRTVAGTLLLTGASRGVEAAPGAPTASTQPGIRVITTIDLELQRLAEASVRSGLTRLETDFSRLRRADPAARLQAALIAIHVPTGEIRALVGGRDFGASQFNRALLARRQPGSAFKPFLYLTALTPRRGRLDFTPASVVSDEPIRIPMGGTVWEPRNYGGPVRRTHESSACTRDQLQQRRRAAGAARRPRPRGRHGEGLRAG